MQLLPPSRSVFHVWTQQRKNYRTQCYLYSNTIFPLLISAATYRSYYLKVLFVALGLGR